MQASCLVPIQPVFIQHIQNTQWKTGLQIIQNTQWKTGLQITQNTQWKTGLQIYNQQETNATNKNSNHFCGTNRKMLKIV